MRARRPARRWTGCDRARGARDRRRVARSPAAPPAARLQPPRAPPPLAAPASRAPAATSRAPSAQRGHRARPRTAARDARPSPARRAAPGVETSRRAQTRRKQRHPARRAPRRTARSATPAPRRTLARRPRPGAALPRAPPARRSPRASRPTRAVPISRRTDRCADCPDAASNARPARNRPHTRPLRTPATAAAPPRGAARRRPRRRSTSRRARARAAAAVDQLAPAERPARHAQSRAAPSDSAPRRATRRCPPPRLGVRASARSGRPRPTRCRAPAARRARFADAPARPAARSLALFQLIVRYVTYTASGGLLPPVMKVEDLPIYSDYPENNVEYRLEVRPEGFIQSKLIKFIKPVRVQFQKWFACFEQSTEQRVTQASITSKSIYQRIRDEPIILARGGFITLCGLGGVIMGYRGGTFRKISYATLSATLATAACYPSATYNYGVRALNFGSTKFLNWKEELTKKVGA
ncbi:unnamed protein product [Dicrocoelium dendriticum]|nr:unnamed protein product [Dicrocoelium dendriticum]